MTRDQIISTVISSNPEDWHNSETGSFETTFYVNDVNLYIKEGEVHSENFNEPWHQNLSDPLASSTYYLLYYNNTLIYKTILISVDGGRALVPLPAPRNHVDIQRLDYQMATALDHPSSEEYIQRLNFNIID